MIQLGKTYLESEAAAGPEGKMRRRGKARFPDGKLRKVKAGIPDTFFSIPAVTKAEGQKVKGFLMIEGGELRFYVNR